jgi:hypothetical protein
MLWSLVPLQAPNAPAVRRLLLAVLRRAVAERRVFDSPASKARRAIDALARQSSPFAAQREPSVRMVARLSRHVREARSVTLRASSRLTTASRAERAHGVGRKAAAGAWRVLWVPMRPARAHLLALNAKPGPSRVTQVRRPVQIVPLAISARGVLRPLARAQLAATPTRRACRTAASASCAPLHHFVLLAPGILRRAHKTPRVCNQV